VTHGDAQEVGEWEFLLEDDGLKWGGEGKEGREGG
jgi:hypothetical protein